MLIFRILQIIFCVQLFYRNSGHFIYIFYFQFADQYPRCGKAREPQKIKLWQGQEKHCANKNNGENEELEAAGRYRRVSTSSQHGEYLFYS
jgi:hypothetical protein